MGQSLLNVGLTTSAAMADKKIAKDSSSIHEDKEAKPFASALNDQVEKKTDNHVKKNESTQLVKNKDDKNTPDDEKEAEDVVAESGKDLPKEAVVEHDEKEAAVEHDEKVVSEEDTDIPLISDRIDSTVISATEPVDKSKKIAKQNPVMENKEQIKFSTEPVTEPVDKSKKIAKKNPVMENKEQIKSSTEQSKNKQIFVLSAMDNQPIDDTIEHDNVKPVLRSDILNAIVKKGDMSNQKIESSATKEFKATVEKQLELPLNGEHKKIDKLLGSSDNQALALRAVNDRVSTSFSSTLNTPALSSMSSTSSSASQASSLAQTALTMQPAVQSEAWGKVLSSRVVWMAKEGVQRAELRLNPANLGPVEVKLHIHNEQASVAFVAHHAATRDALEQAMPRLRESFQDNGMNLTDANVSDQAPEQQSEGDNSDNASVLNQSDQKNNGRLENEEKHIDIDSGELELGVNVFA